MRSNKKSNEHTAFAETALIFLRLGCTSFGGPAAHLAMMEEEFVRRRKWITEEKFIELLGIVNLIPGPNSTEMAIQIGYERAGRKGLVIAGVCFILPAMAIVLAIAWGYKNYGRLPEVQNMFYGIKPVVLAIVVQAVWNLTRKTAKKGNHLVIGIAATLANLSGLSEIPIFIFLGLAAMGTGVYRRRPDPHNLLSIPFFGGLFSKPAVLAGGTAAALVPFGNLKLFTFFLKVGSVLYGSGYVLLSFLQTELVDHYGWLTQSQLLDATAVGQFTPGPVFTTATFIGYLLSGVSGALIATIGIFLPSFFLVGFSTRFVPWLRKSYLAGCFLDGVNAASLGLMAAVTFRLGKDALVDPLTILIALFCTIILIRWRPNSMWLVLGGGTLRFLRVNF